MNGSSDPTVVAGRWRYHDDGAFFLSSVKYSQTALVTKKRVVVLLTQTLRQVSDF